MKNKEGTDVTELNNQIQKSLESFTESFRIAIQEVNNLTKNIPKTMNEFISGMQGFLESIDYSKLSEIQRTHIQNTMIMLQQGWKLDWYLSDELILVLLDRYESLVEEYAFDEQVVKNYFEENFNILTDRAINHPFYENHKELLIDSKLLFEEKRYAISVYPLFSAIDNLFTRWITKPKQFQIDNNTKYIDKEKKIEIKKFKEDYNPNLTLDTAHLTIYSAYQGFLYYFKGSSNRNSLNRNIYMHGNYKYSSMDKVKCLKLWSMLILCIDCIEELQRLKKAESKGML